MKKEIKNGLIQGIIGATTMLVIGVTYAATVSSGQTLTADLFNEKTVPTGAVMAFNGTTCPIGWNAADGSGDEKDTQGNLTTLNLENEFIRGISSTRTLRNKENATKVLTVGEIGLSNDIYFGADSSIYSDYDGIVPGYNERTGRIQITGTYQSSNERANLLSVRPTNVALLFCIKN